MVNYIAYCMNIFFYVLDVVVLLYLIKNILPFGQHVKYIIDMLIIPILIPMQKIVKHSILKCFRVDISPYILLIIQAYLHSVCMYLRIR